MFWSYPCPSVVKILWLRFSSPCLFVAAFLRSLRSFAANSIRSFSYSTIPKRKQFLPPLRRSITQIIVRRRRNFPKLLRTCVSFIKPAPKAIGHDDIQPRQQHRHWTTIVAEIARGIELIQQHPFRRQKSHSTLGYIADLSIRSNQQQSV